MSVNRVIICFVKDLWKTNVLASLSFWLVLFFSQYNYRLMLIFVLLQQKTNQVQIFKVFHRMLIISKNTILDRRSRATNRSNKQSRNHDRLPWYLCTLIIFLILLLIIGSIMIPIGLLVLNSSTTTTTASATSSTTVTTITTTCTYKSN